MQKIPHVTFKYDIEKDAHNIEIGLRMARNGRIPDQFLQSIIEKYGTSPSREELIAHVGGYWKERKDIRKIITSQLQEYWDSIEEKFFTHLADRMQLDSFCGVEELTGFLSSRGGAGYDVEGEWFGVMAHYGTLQSTMTSMHEIMHIFFYKQWGVFL